MAKVALLVPNQEMCTVAEPLLDEFPAIHVMDVEHIQTGQVAARAHELEQQGCDLIVARGVQARIIRKAVRLPLVEICVTQQELACVMMDMKAELGMDCPRIGLIGFPNMLSDTAHFNRLFGIDLRLYMVEQNEALPQSVNDALRDGCNAVIGGDIVCEAAECAHLPYRFIPSGEESLRNALTEATRVAYAIDLEKHNTAEINALLNYTFSGIVQVDHDRIIRRVNRVSYNLLGRTPSALLGRELSTVLPNLDQRLLTDALQSGKETYAFLLDIDSKAVVVNIAPILVDERIEGAVLTFQEGQRLIEMDSELRRELFQRGFVARYTFANVPCESEEMHLQLDLARRVSKFAAPVLITGEAGCGKGILAQCIHNESLVHKNAFITVDCSAWQPETLDNMLFGNYTVRKDSAGDCYAEMAQDGTLYLCHVEQLALETQYKLFMLTRGRFLHNGPSRPVAANVRVIASTDINLITRVETGEFRSDLYYSLSALTVELPPLRRRREDIESWMDQYLDEWQKKYKRYISLTQGARRYLREYDWPGNLDQMYSVCERLVLLAQKRTIDEAFLRQQLDQIAPHILSGTDQVVVYQDPKAVKLADLMARYGGNRQKVADELGVSKTTLWRYLKKYDIGTDPHA